MRKTNRLVRLLLFWAVNTLVLWIADYLFTSLRFDSLSALVVSGLLFGIVNATLKPLLVILTAPITVLTLGFFLLVINALMLLLIAWLVPGFHLAGFWNAFFISIFIWIVSFILNLVLGLK